MPLHFVLKSRGSARARQVDKKEKREQETVMAKGSIEKGKAGTRFEDRE